MKHIPLIRANVIKGFATFLEETGVSAESLLNEMKLPALALQAPESLLPFKQVAEFYAAAARKTGCEHFGLLVGQKTSIVNLGAYGRLLSQSLTLHDAINKGIYMVPTYTSGEQFWLEEHGDQIWICRHFVTEPGQAMQQADHFSVMVTIDLIRLAAGSQWRPSQILLQTPSTSGLENFEALSNAAILFQQKVTAVVFPRSFLTLPLRNLNFYHDHQRCEDYELLHSSAPATNFPGSVRQIIATLLQEQQTDIQVVAEIVGMSVRTFQRQLNELDLTYSRLVEQVRFEQSLRLLAAPEVKLAEIAGELGYTDAANFTRAFKRWTGVSPTEFRHLQWQM